MLPSRNFLAGAPVLAALTYAASSGKVGDVLRGKTANNTRCPAGTGYLDGYLIAPTTSTWPAEGIQALTATTWSADQALDWSLSDSFANLASSNSLQIVVGTYTVILTCYDQTGSTALGTFNGTIRFTDTTNWVTSASGPLPVRFEGVTTDPAGVVTLGGALSLVATLDQTTAAGTVSFTQRVPAQGSQAIATKATVSAGKATLPLSGLAVGLYYFSAGFTPTDANAFGPATSEETVLAVVPPTPPTPPASAAIQGTAKVGSALTCTAGSFTGATTTGWQWYRDFDPVDGVTTADYTPSSDDVGHLLRCRATGTNSGGLSGRFSPGVEVKA